MHQSRKRRFNSALTVTEIRQDRRAARLTVATPAKVKTRTAAALAVSTAKRCGAPNAEDARRNDRSIRNRARMTKLSPILVPTRNRCAARRGASRCRRATPEDALCATGRIRKTPQLPTTTITIMRMTILA